MVGDSERRDPPTTGESVSDD